MPPDGSKPTEVEILRAGLERITRLDGIPDHLAGGVAFALAHVARATLVDAAAVARPAEAERVTHGRHCTCTACARQDWAEVGLAPCGMHGPSCPPVYDPWGAPGSVARRSGVVADG